MLHTHSLITYRHYLFSATDNPVRQCTLRNNHIPMLLYISERWTLKEYIIRSIKKAETIFPEVAVRCRNTNHTRNKNMNRTKHKLRNRLWNMWIECSISANLRVEDYRDIGPEKNKFVSQQTEHPNNWNSKSFCDPVLVLLVYLLFIINRTLNP